MRKRWIWTELRRMDDLGDSPLVAYVNHRAGCLLKLAFEKALWWARRPCPPGVHRTDCLSAIAMKILDPRLTLGAVSSTPGTINRPKGPFIDAIDFCPDDIGSMCRTIGTQYISFPFLTDPKKPSSILFVLALKTASSHFFIFKHRSKDAKTHGFIFIPPTVKLCT